MVDLITDLVKTAGSSSGLEGEALLAHRFSVEVTGPITNAAILPITGFFTEVEGLEAEIEVIEYETTTIYGQSITQKIPGRVKWGELTLRRGVTNNMGFWGWHEIVQNGLVALARASVTITMYDLTGDAYAVWDLDKAWPSKVSGPQLNAGENEVGIEELTLVHEGLSRVDTGWTSVLFSII